MNNESKVERYLNTEIKKLGGLTRKWTSPNHVGVPDRIVVIEGLVVFVEVKTEKGKLSPMQEREIERLKQQGAICRVVYGQQGVDVFIKEVKQHVDSDHPRNITRLLC